MSGSQGPLLTQEQLDALRMFDSATIANAIEKFKVRDATDGYSSLELRCMFPELPPVVGYAVTCTDDSTTPYREGRPSLDYEFYKAIDESPKPVIVVMKNVGPDRLRSNHVGDIMATTFQRMGVVAAMTDGGIRDLAGMRERAPGFQIFAGGAVVSHGVPVVVEVGMTVTICGLTISPGDLLHADANGVVSIPHAIAGQLAEQAQKVVQRERDTVAFIKSPEFSLNAFAKRQGWI